MILQPSHQTGFVNPRGVDWVYKSPVTRRRYDPCTWKRSSAATARWTPAAGSWGASCASRTPSESGQSPSPSWKTSTFRQRKGRAPPLSRLRVGVGLGSGRWGPRNRTTHFILPSTFKWRMIQRENSCAEVLFHRYLQRATLFQLLRIWQLREMEN